MTEIWLPVSGFESCYEVSCLGRVRSKDRLVRNGSSAGKIVKAKIKSFAKNSQGYLSVHLYKNSAMKKIYVHRLVAMHFIDDASRGDQVNHKNGDKSDNRAVNLEWCTGSENCAHAIRERLYKNARGERIGGAKLSENDVREIRHLAAAGFMHKELSEKFGVGRKAITKIVNMQRWAHVT